MSLANLIIYQLPQSSLSPYLTRYEIGVTLLSTPVSVLSALACYFLAIFGLQKLMRQHKPLRFTPLFQLHNSIISVASFILLVLIVEEIVPIVYTHGLFYGLCAKDAWTPRLEFYYMINYYFKYLELFDTIFLVTKKKPLSFLHVFHHSATVFLVYVNLNSRTSFIWLPISLNLGVHVFMYYYYYASAGGRNIWWKKYLTSMQIVQFTVVLPVCVFAIYTRYTSLYIPQLPSLGMCASPLGATFLGTILYGSYLYLFVLFYKSTFEKTPTTKGGASVVVIEHTNGSGAGVSEHEKAE